MSVEFERNIEDAETVVSYLEQGHRPEELYEEAVYGVHNGFCLQNENYLEADNLRREDYFAHAVDLHNYLERKLDEETAFYAVHRARSEDEVLGYLGELSEYVDGKVASSFSSGFIVDDAEKRKLADSLNSLADGARVTLCSEINGLCGLQFEDLFREINRLTDREFDIVRGLSFPKRPLDRNGGRLHWDGEEPEDERPPLPKSCI